MCDMENGNTKAEWHSVHFQPQKLYVSKEHSSVEKPLISYISYKTVWPGRLGVEMEKETRIKNVGLQKW
jgi:hypothetical protein